MENNLLSEYIKDINRLNQQLKSTTKRSSKLIQEFVDTQDELTLNQAWVAIEMITEVLENIQSKLIKISF